jgi:hypothetical protein
MLSRKPLSGRGTWLRAAPRFVFRSDYSKCRVADVAVRIFVRQMILSVEGFGRELKLSKFSNLNAVAKREIYVVERITT